MEDLDKGLKKVERQTQKNINSRLDRMRFCNYTRSEFTNTAPHASTDISFVTDTGGEVSIYKGDTKISGEGSDVDVKYAALVGFGTGIGGERTGQNEITNLRNNSREYIDSGNVLGNKRASVSFWIDTNGNEHYSQYLTTKQTALRGKGDFVSGISDIGKSSCILCYRMKFIVSPFVRSSYYSWQNQTPLPNIGVSITAPRVNHSLYLYRKNASGSGWTRETLQFSMEIGGLIPYSATTRRACVDLVPTYKIKVTKNGVSRYIDGLYRGGFIGARNSSQYSNACGFLFGCEEIVHTDGSANYGQIKNPGLLWVNNGIIYTIPETPDNPYGIFYDISNGSALREPTLQFYNSTEKNLAYILCLPRSEYV